MENNELYHHGIQGMKWGVRRYQNEDGSLTEEGRRHYGYGARAIVTKLKTKHEARVLAKKKKKQAKEREKRLEEARKAKAEKKAHEEAKKKALETGSAEDILKYKDEYSLQEKQQAYNRLQADSNLTRMAREDAAYKAEQAARNSKWNKAVRLAEKASQAADSITKLTKLYNSSAKVVNAFSEEKLPIIGEKLEKTAKEKFGKSMELGDEIVKNYKDLSIDEIEENLKRAELVQKAEKIAAGETGKKK